MAVSVEKLYKKAAVPYHMRQQAGKSGMGNLIEWVHIIEDENAVHFLHGNELVFTAGIRSGTDDKWLIHFTRSLYDVGAKALVVNLGPHIREIPEEVTAFCEQAGFPLFTIPWETRMVDMTRDFCESIIQAEHVEMTLASCLKNILFHIGDASTQILQMERYGYLRDSGFCFVCVKLDVENDERYSKYKKMMTMQAQSLAKNINELLIHFEYQDLLILVLNGYTQEDVERYVSDYLDSMRSSSFFSRLFLGVSEVRNGLQMQEENFQRAMKCCRLACQLNEQVLYYKKIGIYQLLLAVNDRVLLESFYEGLVGKVAACDRENGTDYIGFLKSYVRCDGSPQKVAQELFIHRNTVNNTIKKIEAITGADLNSMEGRIHCVIGLYIADLL